MTEGHELITSATSLGRIIVLLPPQCQVERLLQLHASYFVPIDIQ
jgi:hypothetical protein